MQKTANKSDKYILKLIQNKQNYCWVTKFCFNAEIQAKKNGARNSRHWLNYY